MKRLALLPLLLAQTLLAQYTELTNAEGVTIKAMVFDAGDPIKIKTEAGQYFSIPLDKFSEKTKEKLESLDIPQFSSVVDMSNDPQTGKLRNQNQRIIILKGNEPILGFYPSERMLLRDHFERCIEHYESKVSGKVGITVTAFSEPKNRISENPNPNLNWDIETNQSDVIFSLPRAYAPVIFDSFYKGYGDGSLDPFASPKNQKGEDNGIYDTKAVMLGGKPPSIDPFAAPKSSNKPHDPFASKSDKQRLRIDKHTFYYLYEYLKLTDFDQVVKDALESK